MDKINQAYYRFLEYFGTRYHYMAWNFPRFYQEIWFYTIGDGPITDECIIQAYQRCYEDYIEYLCENS